MVRMLLLLLLITTLVGCGSVSNRLPRCDGYSRRPLNRAMWQWEDDGKTHQSTTGAIVPDPTSRAASFADEPVFVTPAVFAHFDIDGSYRPCKGK